MPYGRNQGFTLVEVLFALSLFALGALAALNVASQHVRSVSYLQERSFALQVASNHLAELVAQQGRQGSWPPKDGAQGVIDWAGQDWYWEQEVLETVTNDLRQVRVLVRSKEQGPVLAELLTFVGRR